MKEGSSLQSCIDVNSSNLAGSSPYCPSSPSSQFAARTSSSSSSSSSVVNNHNSVRRSDLLSRMNLPLSSYEYSNDTELFIPHKGSLRRLTPISTAQPQEAVVLYYIELQEEEVHRRILFTKAQLDCMQRLFLVLDVESKGYLTYTQVEEFIHTRCPVVKRRDLALQQQTDSNKPTTLLEAWHTILRTSRTTTNESDGNNGDTWNSSTFQEASHENSLFYTHCTALSLEGWMILLRLVSFCQYEEAKQFFSEKRCMGNNAIMVDIPRSPPLIPLTLENLILYEIQFDYRRSPNNASNYNNNNHLPFQYCPPMPELDLNHSGISANDSTATNNTSNMVVTVESIGSFSDVFWQNGKVELLLTVTTTTTTNPTNNNVPTPNRNLMSTAAMTSTNKVRRTLEDLIWLHDTFGTHKKLGGTLCGRILPPLLPPQDFLLCCSSDTRRYTRSGTTSSDPTHVSASTSSTSGLWSYCKSVGKSIVGSISTTTRNSTNITNSNHSNSRERADSFSITQELKLRRFERYLNYLLSHSGYKSSFPLNSLLKASKTGLEATKRLLILEDVTSANKLYSSEDNTSNSSSNNNNNSNHGTSNIHIFSNLDWVRTAAQAAMALQVHGFLNATGMSTYSAKLQHASLPDLDYHQRYRGDYHHSPPPPPHHQSIHSDAESHNNDTWESDGVTLVESTLDDDYDMLPTPTERNKKSLYFDVNNNSSSSAFRTKASSPDGLANGIFLDGEDDTKNNIDATIEKLHDTIASVDEYVNKCFSSFEKIAAAVSSRADIHLNIVHALDSHAYNDPESALGFLITMDEQCYLRGVTEIERCFEATTKSNIETCEALSWQASLSTAAVCAAEDVRSAVRAARTAASAKIAAEKASATAKKTLGKLLKSTAASSSNSKDEEAIHVAQTRVEISKSHEIHAALIAHETATVKRKAAVALAYDVCQWSDHRRREMIQNCISTAKSQQRVSRNWAESWRVLKEAVVGPLEGEYGTSVLLESFKPKLSDDSEFTSTSDSPSSTTSPNNYSKPSSDHLLPSSYMKNESLTMGNSSANFAEEASFKCYERNLNELENSYTGGIASSKPTETLLETSDFLQSNFTYEPSHYSKAHVSECSTTRQDGIEADTNCFSKSSTPSFMKKAFSDNFLLPDHDENSSRSDIQGEDSNNPREISESYTTPDLIKRLSPQIFSQEPAQVSKSPLPLLTNDTSSSREGDSFASYKKESDAMTASMQSLVEGLISWGTLFDQHDDISLPAGLAVSLAMEEGVKDYKL